MKSSLGSDDHGVSSWLIALLAAALLAIAGVIGYFVLQSDDDRVDVGVDDGVDDGAGANGDDAADDDDPDTTTTTTTTTTEPAPVDGVDLALFLESDSCGVVPGGGLDGGDAVTFFFRVTNVGTESYDGPVQATARSNTGLTGSSTGTPSDGGPASSFVQAEFAPQDYGRTHTFSIEIEPVDDVEDVNLTNNVDTIDVVLPETRPSESFDPCAS